MNLGEINERNAGADYYCFLPTLAFQPVAQLGPASLWKSVDLEVQTSHASVESAPQLRLRVISWNFARRVGWIGLGGGSGPSCASAIVARGFGGEVGGLRTRVQPE